MATDVILPALGMSQDTGKIVQWLKAEGQQVAKDDPLVEIETDKAVVEVVAQADGVLTQIRAAAGDDVPVGQVIATILAPGETLPPALGAAQPPQDEVPMPTEAARPFASPLASRIAAEHELDLSLIKSAGRRIQKADVLTYLQNQEPTPTPKQAARLVMASPKARRLASEQGRNLAAIRGSGPGGAVLAADVLATLEVAIKTNEADEVIAVSESLVRPPINGNSAGIDVRSIPTKDDQEASAALPDSTNTVSLSTTWRIMAERTTQSWTSVPHFYLMREVNARRLIAWREHSAKRMAEKKARKGADQESDLGAQTASVTYTDLLVKIAAVALRMHPRLRASWSGKSITLSSGINLGLAVAIEEGLVVPVIHQADRLSLGEIARQREELVAKARSGKLRPQDLSEGTFTISNLGMYNVDAFSAIINQPQTAILAVGRIADRVVPLNGQPVVQPMMTLTLSCDHRSIDGARGAQFLDTLATLIEEPLELLSQA